MFEGSFVFTLTRHPPGPAAKEVCSDLMFDDDRKMMTARSRPIA